MKEVATFLQNVLQGEAAVSVEVREGRGRCLVASKQIEVENRSHGVLADSFLGLGDKGLFLEIRATRSVLGAFIHIKEICFCRIVLLCKFGPTKAKLLFSKYKGF